MCVSVGKEALEKRRNGLTFATELRDPTAEGLLKRLSDLDNYPDDTLAPYEEFKLDEKTYYFTPGGFLYRKDPGSRALGGFFCGYLTDEAWHYRTDDG
jgi:hypothetical protein